MEDEEGIGLVLARATELRLKISDCMEKATSSNNPSPKERQCRENDKGVENSESDPNFNGEVSDGEDEMEVGEAERLLHVRDALESLETQLAALQNLRQRQQYEKQVALSEIDCSRRMLLEKLKEYKGRNLDVLQETSAFAGEKVEYENDLLLPPYPSRPPLSLVSDSGHLSNLTSKQKPVQNGLVSADFTNEAKKNNLYDSESSSKGIGHFVSSVAKVVLPIVGVISLLGLSGLGLEIKKRGSPLKLLGFNQSRGNKEKRSIQCPPGKILVVENGEARCLVKERVEIPFESVVSAKRDVNYGYG